MTLAATFLAGARSRLLPASVPFRYFAAAAVFHVLTWMALLAAAEQLTSFRGGPGPALAAAHLLTLGVLTTTAIGASAQLLPVATCQALAAVWPLRLVFWLVVPGIATTVAGMFTGQSLVLIPAATATTVGLLLFAVVLADNLRRARSLPVVAAYGWAALAALVPLAALGLALAVDYETGVLADHGSVASAHMILGGFGFMGLLVLGFSHVLVPMFALSAAPSKARSFIGFGLALAGVFIGTAGALSDSAPVLACAGAIGLAAAAQHLWLMLDALRHGMRKRLGLSFVLIRAAWAMLPLVVLLGLAALYGLAGPNGSTLFGLLLIGGWLLTFLLGVLQRIVPFLASMHVPRAAGAAPPLVLSELTRSPVLQVHAVCHGAALALLAASVVADAPSLARTGAAVGLVGALAFAWFLGDVVRRIAVAR